MENSTQSSTGVFHTFRRWSMYRQLRYILDYRKISLVVILSLVSFGRYIHHNSIHFDNKPQEISSISVVKSYVTQNIGITSNPEIIHRMAERKKVLSQRKRLAESVCRNITKGGLISESLSLWLTSPKMDALQNYHPKEKMLRGDIWLLASIFGDLSQSGNFMRLSHL